MLYLGQPYSHPKSVIREVRYLAAMQACAYFQFLGICVYSPIVHWHQVSMMHKLPSDTETWQLQWYPMLKKADRFAMLLLDGWEQSLGLKDEWFEAKQLDLPIERYVSHAGETYWVGEGLIVWPSTA